MKPELLRGDLAAALGFEAGTAREWLAWAQELVDQGDLEGARTVLEGASALAPEDAVVLGALAAVMHELGEAAIALGLYERTLELDRLSVLALAGAASVLVEQGRHDRAARLLERALALDPDARTPAGARAHALVRSLSFHAGSGGPRRA